MQLLVRILLAILWTIFLVSFAYYPLIFDIFEADGIGFEGKLREVHSVLTMAVVSIGLVIMLMLDACIIKMATNVRGLINIRLILFWIAALVLGLALVGFGYAKTTTDIAEWMKLSYIFLVFVLVIITCKFLSFAENVHHSYELKK